MSRKIVLLLLVMLLGLIPASIAYACGGLFCQNVPVSQQAERIIFTVNGDGTLTAYVQINYTGEAPDFSWVVPVPSVPIVDVAEMTTFDEIQTLTDPIIISPQIPDCAPVAMPMMSMADDGATMEEAEVEVLASGTAGPFAYDVVTSPDPDALVDWLVENDYRITPEMMPLIAVYTDEGMIFLAMKLQPDQGVQDIQPVVMTYESEMPIIPIRLTAVAANPNMNIFTWIFANDQAFPTNYAHPAISNDDIRGDFMQFGGTNYLQLVDMTVDVYEGRAFITEYAQPTSEFLNLQPNDELLQTLAQNYRYVTRFYGRMSPEEMTVDPMFELNGNLQDVDNLRNLSNVDPEVFWNCAGAPPINIEFDPDVVPADF